LVKLSPIAKRIGPPTNSAKRTTVGSKNV